MCLAAGLDGLQNRIMPAEPVEQEPDAMSSEAREELGITALPAGLGEAIAAMEQDPLIRQTLGERFVRSYLEAKRAEWKEYMPQVTQWEVEKYLCRI